MSAWRGGPIGLRDGRVVELREVAPGDAGPVLAYARGTATTTDQIGVMPDELPETVEQERALLAAIVDDPRSTMIVSWHAGEVVGSLHVRGINRRRLGHTASIGMMVAQGWRGVGLGSALLRAAIEWSRLRPWIEKLSLDVFATNEAGLRLYRSFGFEMEGRQAGQGQVSPGVYVDNLVMGLWIKPRGTGSR